MKKLTIIALFLISISSFAQNRYTYTSDRFRTTDIHTKITSGWTASNSIFTLEPDAIIIQLAPSYEKIIYSIDEVNTSNYGKNVAFRAHSGSKKILFNIADEGQGYGSAGFYDGNGVTIQFHLYNFSKLPL